MPNLKVQNKTEILKNNHSDSLSLTLEAIEAGLQSVNPTSIIKKSVLVKRNCLTVTDFSGKKIDFDLGDFKSIYLIGAGKATASMSDSFIHVLKKEKRKTHE